MVNHNKVKTEALVHIRNMLHWQTWILTTAFSSYMTHSISEQIIANSRS